MKTIVSIFYRRLVFGFFLGAVAIAAPQTVRWTVFEDKNSDLLHIIQELKAKTNLPLSVGSFLLVENRALANSHFTMLAQVAGGIPLKGMNLRIWKNLTSGETIQVEGRLDQPPAQAMMDSERTGELSATDTMNLVRQALRGRDDARIRSVDWSDAWDRSRLVRIVKVKAAHGTHFVTLAHSNKRVLSITYKEFPQNGEFSVPIDIYPIYETAPGQAEPMARVRSELRYLSGTTVKPDADPYAALKERKYLFSKFDPIRGLTEEGQKQGFWAMSLVRHAAAQLLARLPQVDNAYANGGVVLDGRYVTVNYYPNVSTAGLNFSPKISPQFRPDFLPVAGTDDYEMVPAGALRGRPLMTADEALTRLARRDPQHNPTTYMNDGFDELQVYWSVNQMFDSLRPMGFTDPDLSTRRFNAFLFDPDIEYRDNAFYTDDTINFTTYSPQNENMARDNTTIWHELGHGVMDRLMGDFIQLADTGGLSEGMADFVAQLVLNDVTEGKNFAGKNQLRIFNNTGFHLTNEVHDDGEAYGGSMNDLLVTAMATMGRAGLTKVTDLTLEAMRLSRNHPALTAADWFNHMLFADQLGHEPVRKAGELQTLIVKSLAGRNFMLDGSEGAKFTLRNGETEVTSQSVGSRENPIRLKLAEDETATYHLSVNVRSVEAYKFQYPVTVKVGLRGGPLQGAIHWNGEEAEALTYTLQSETDTLPIDLTVTGKCDAVNQPDGSCKDFAYVQIFNQGTTGKPQAKKRFYLRISKP